MQTLSFGASAAGDPTDAAHWELDDLQARVFDEPGPVLAIAGPGSGKTRTIVAKAAKLIAQHGGNPGAVALVTFTRASATEMLQRLRKAMPGTPLSPRNTYIGTFHALCYRQLGAYWARRKIQPKVLTDYEASTLIAQVLRDGPQPAPKLEEVTDAIARYKSLPVDHPFTEAERQGALYQAFEAYEVRRRASGALEKNDLVRECLTLIRAGDIAPLPVHHLLADEMQDADAVQLDWVLAHHRHGVVTTLVADDDQSIYGFRHAAGFAGLQAYRDATGAAVVPMTRNYRSGRRIVDAARCIIEANPDRFAKTIQASRSAPGRLLLCGGHGNEADQALAVARQAAAWLQAHPGGTAAVISRTNLELDLPEQACRVLGQPFIRLGSSDFLSRAHVASALLAVRCAVDPFDGIAFAASVSGCCALSQEARQRIAGYFHDRHGSEHVLDVACQPELLSGMRRDDQTAFRAFRAHMSEWFDQAGEGEEAPMSAALSLFLGHLAAGHTAGRSADIESLRVMLTRWCRGSLHARLALIERKPAPAAHQEGAVTLCTAHASKGLEFGHVTVINADEHTWPHDKADAGLAEERRLLYVAATRARDCLTFSTVHDGAPTGALSPLLVPVWDAGLLELQADDATCAPGAVVNA